MEEIIRIYYPDDNEAVRRLSNIMRFFDATELPTIMKIYNHSPDFIRFCYKAFSNRPEVRIARNLYGFAGTPHTDWEMYQGRITSSFIKDMIYEVAFRMMQQVFNIFTESSINYSFIKHANTMLSRYYITTKIISNHDAEIIQGLSDALSYYKKLMEFNNITIYYELYEHCANADEFKEIIYFYNCVYSFKYDFVPESAATVSLIRFNELNDRLMIIDKKTAESLTYNISNKYHLLDE